MNNKDGGSNLSNRQISINMITNIVSYSSNILISFVLTPFLINTLGKEVYGFYPIANTFVSYFSIITSSINAIASRYVTFAIVKSDNDEASRSFTSTLIINAFIGIVMFFPMMLLVIFLDEILEVPINVLASARLLFLLIFVSAIINILGGVFGIATFAVNRVDLASLREMIVAFVRLILLSLMYYLLPANIIYVGITAVIIALINVTVNFTFTKKLLPKIIVSRDYISKKISATLFRYSCWNMAFMIGNVLLAGMTLVLANVFFGASVSGTLAIVQTVPQFLNGIIGMLVGVFSPVITAYIAQGKRLEAHNELEKISKIIGIIVGSVIIVFSGMASEFFKLWTPYDDAELLASLSLITIVPHIFIACTWSITNLNIALNKVVIPAKVTIIMGIMNLVLGIMACKFFQSSYIILPIISSILQVVWSGVFLPIYAESILNFGRYDFFYLPVKVALLSVVSYYMIILTRGYIFINDWCGFFLYASGFYSLVVCFLSFFIFGKKDTMKFICKYLK